MIRELLAFVMPRFLGPEPAVPPVRVGASFSEAILRGCQITENYPYAFLTRGTYACVIGAALKGVGFPCSYFHPSLPEHRAFFEKHFGPLEEMDKLYERAYGKHFESELMRGEMTREGIAERFARMGQ